MQPNSPLSTALSLLFSPLSCLSHTDSRTKTPFNLGKTWQQMSASILHLINGNDSSVIHHPGWHFFFLLIYFLPSSRRNELFSQSPLDSSQLTRLPSDWGICMCVRTRVCVYVCVQVCVMPPPFFLTFIPSAAFISDVSLLANGQLSPSNQHVRWGRPTRSPHPRNKSTEWER